MCLASCQLGGSSIAVPDICRAPVAPVPLINKADGIMAVPSQGKVLYKCTPAQQGDGESRLDAGHRGCRSGCESAAGDGACVLHFVGQEGDPGRRALGTTDRPAEPEWWQCPRFSCDSESVQHPAHVVSGCAAPVPSGAEHRRRPRQRHLLRKPHPHRQRRIVVLRIIGLGLRCAADQRQPFLRAVGQLQ